MSGYRIVLEPTRTGFSAYSPDLPGCIATAATDEEVRKRMAAAIRLHEAGLRKTASAGPPPDPT